MEERKQFTDEDIAVAVSQLEKKYKSHVDAFGEKGWGCIQYNGVWIGFNLESQGMPPVSISYRTTIIEVPCRPQMLGYDVNTVREVLYQTFINLGWMHWQ